MTNPNDPNKMKPKPTYTGTASHTDRQAPVYINPQLRNNENKLPNMNPTEWITKHYPHFHGRPRPVIPHLHPVCDLRDPPSRHPIDDLRDAPPFRPDLTRDTPVYTIDLSDLFVKVPKTPLKIKSKL